MKISLVCISLRGGGTERIVSRMANHLAKCHEIGIVTLVQGEPFYLLEEGVEVVQPPASLQQQAKPIRTLRQLNHLFSACRRARPDLCLVFGEDIGGIVTATARLAGVMQMSIFFRGTPERSLSGINGFFNPVLCRLADRIIVQTRTARQRLSGRYPTERITVWSNPIEIPETVRTMSEREPVIVNVGSIGRHKNQEGLVRIFRRLERRGNWHLEFIGDGPKRDVLERRVAEGGSQISVTFTGQVKEVGPHLDRAAIFAFTSLSEGFPNALAEALAAGCACISYDCPTGPSELIEDGVNGFLVPMGDEIMYAKKLQRLMDDEQLRVQFSANARVHMTRYEAGTSMKSLEALLGIDCGNTAGTA